MSDARRWDAPVISRRAVDAFGHGMVSDVNGVTPTDVFDLISTARITTLRCGSRAVEIYLNDTYSDETIPQPITRIAEHYRLTLVEKLYIENYLGMILYKI